MADESYSFSTARTRLEEIVSQVRKKDTSLEKSLDLLEEGVRLANACTELIDHQDWVSAPSAEESEQPSEAAVLDAEQAPDTAPAAPVADAGESPIAGAGVFDAETVVFDAVPVAEQAAVADSTSAIDADAVAGFEDSEDFTDADDAWADESEPPSARPDDPAASED